MELSTDSLSTTSAELEELANEKILGWTENLGRSGISTSNTSTQASVKTAKTGAISKET
jgi:hypothetical protein